MTHLLNSLIQVGNLWEQKTKCKLALAGATLWKGFDEYLLFANVTQGINRNINEHLSQKMFSTDFLWRQ